MIHTREQLIHEIEKILIKRIYDGQTTAYGIAVELVNLIADLNSNCFHDKDEDWKTVP